MLQKEVNRDNRSKKITLENPKSIIPRAKEVPINFRDSQCGADIKYVERKIPKRYIDDNEL